MRRLKILLRSNKKYLLLFLCTLAFALLNSYEVINASFASRDFKEVINVVNYHKTTYGYQLESDDGLYLYYTDEVLELDFTQVYLIEGYYKEPSKNTVPNLFNYNFYLKSRKIFKYGVIKELKYLKEQKNLKAILRSLLFKRASSLKKPEVYKALVIGYKKDLSKEFINLLNLTGISHLLSLSGLHIGLLAVILSKVFKRIFKVVELADGLLALVLLSYAYISFASVSIFRATIMYIVLVLSKNHRLNLYAIDGLFISGIIILIVNPLESINVSFYFSFIIVFFILMTKPYLNKNHLNNALRLSVICFLSSLPIVISFNYQIYLLSFIVNMIVIPIFTVLIFPLSLLSFCFPLFNDLFCFVFDIFTLLVSKIYFKEFMVIFFKPTILQMLGYYLVLIVALSKRSRLLIASCLLLFYLSPYFDYQAHVIYIDVGQGDSSLIIYPFRSKTILIDTGGNYRNADEFEITKYKTIPLLKSLGINKIDYLVLTHGDFDHIGEASYLIGNYRVENLVLNCNQRNSLETDLFFEFHQKVIPVKQGFSNELLACRDFDDENDSSIVLKFELYNRILYFGGDISSWYQDRFKFDIDFLKLSHHGSKTSTSEYFLKHTKPEVAISSAGYNNRYSHPHIEVLDILKTNHVKLYRSDLDGSIWLRLRPRSYLVKTFGRN